MQMTIVPWLKIIFVMDQVYMYVRVMDCQKSLMVAVIVQKIVAAMI